MILVIYNYDSFTYNLLDLIRRFVEVKVIRHDEYGPEIVDHLRPEGIVISPGPGRPCGSGISMAVVERYYRTHPILGVCLGHQVIAEVLGDLANVTVASFTGLTVDFARSCQASVMLRGVRTVSDTETEFTMALANHTLAPELETVFLMASERYSHISSTLIKQIAQMGHDPQRMQLGKFVPAAVIGPLLQKVGRRP